MTELDRRAARAVLALSLALAAAMGVACGSSSSGPGGGGGTAGGTGGSGGGGGSGAVDGGVGPGGSATMKFCNRLMRGNMTAIFTLEVGRQPLVLSAATGKCNTDPGAPCVKVPEGVSKIALVDDQDQLIDERNITITPGDHWLLTATVAGTPRRPTVVGDPITPPQSCPDSNPFAGRDASAPASGDGGASDAAPIADAARF